VVLKKSLRSEVLVTDNGLTDPNQNLGVLRHPFFDVWAFPWCPIRAADAGLLLVLDQSLMEVAGRDGQAKKGRVVLEISAGGASTITVT
jgi:hypothetical protein